MGSTIEIFLCYAHEDEEYRRQLEKQLKVFQREELIRVWHDRIISPGEEWEKQIHSHLNTAQIVLLLVSPDFMNSDYCYSIELTVALKRHMDGEACVIPIIVRPVHWTGGPLGKLQALPRDAIPITDSRWHSLDAAFFDVAEGIRTVIEAFIAKSSKDEFTVTSLSYPMQMPFTSLSADEEEHLKTNKPSLRPSKKNFNPEAYRKALHADPNIALIQVLNMSQPLKVTDIYVRIQLHQQTRSSYEIDPVLRNAATGNDPNELLKASRFRLEQRSITPITPEKALHDHKRCVILGDPGTGKTTLLKYLALRSVDHQFADLPIHIELNAFASSGYRDLLEFAASVWEGRYGFSQANALAYMQTRLEEGRALLLLDALDETVAGKTREESEESYQRVVQAIIALASYTPYHDSPLVVTVRKASYYQYAIRLPGFTELEVLDFRHEEIKEFVNRWFTSHPDPQKRASAGDLNARLERNLRIQTLAANPLLLSLIIIVYEDQLDLPDRRSELYKQCVETLLNKWDSSRNTLRLKEFKTEHKEQLLEEVAWHFHLRGQRYFPESELLSVIANISTTIGFQSVQRKQILDEIVTVTGLLKEQAYGWYGFLHLTLQEYFAAQYAVDHNELNILLEHCLDPWWEEVILLYAGSTPDASPLLQKLLGQRDDIFYTDSILAGRCLATRPTIREIHLRDEVLSRLFDLLITTPYSLIQEQVAHALAEISGREVNKYLLDALSDSQLSSNLRGTIAGALGNSGDRSIVPDLLRLLHNQQIDSNVRIAIAYALATLDGRTIVPDLLQMLNDEQIDKQLGGQLPQILGNLGDRSVVPSLLLLLPNEQMDVFARMMIAEALGTLGEGPIVPDLLRLLDNQRIHRQIRESIAHALGTLGNRTVIPDLLRLLSDQYLDLDILDGIVVALGRLNDRSVVPDLLRLLPDENVNEHLRYQIANTLGTLGGHSITSDLIQLLSNEKVNVSVRREIARGIGRIGDRSAVSSLLTLLSSPHINPSVRESIAEVLGRLGNYSTTPSLLSLLSNDQIDPVVQEGIISALGNLGNRSAVPILHSMFVNTLVDPPLHWQLVKASKTFGKQPLTSEFLQSFSKSAYNYIQYLYLAVALGKLGDSSVIPFLLYLLSVPELSDGIEWQVDADEHFINIFQTLGDQSTISSLIQIISKKEKWDPACNPIFNILEQVTVDETNIYELATLLQGSNLADSIHRILWSVSRRENVNVFLVDGPLSKQIEVVKVRS